MTFSLRPYRWSTRPGDGRLGEHAGGLLERGRRDERLGRQRRLGDAQQDRGEAGRLAAQLLDAVVLLLDPVARHLLVEQELGVAGVGDLHEPAHLPHDDLDVLVVDGDALGAVDLLDLVDEVALQLGLAEHREDVVRDRPGRR